MHTRSREAAQWFAHSGIEGQGCVVWDKYKRVDTHASQSVKHRALALPGGKLPKFELPTLLGSLPLSPLDS